MTEDELVTIKSYSQSYEAEIARGLLESQGIWAVVADSHTIGMNWLYSDALGGVKLQVRRRDAEKALEILNEEIEPLPDESGVLRCNSCGSERLEFTSDRRASNWSWLLLGIPIFRPRASWRCLDCGKLQS